MAAVNMHEAKTHFSRLITRVEAGEEVIIARAGKPVAKVVPIESPAKAPNRKFGWLAGQFTIPDDFDTMFQKEIEDMFYGPDEGNDPAVAAE